MDSFTFSQPPTRHTTISLTGVPAGYAQTTVSSSAIALPSIPTGANRAIVQIETGGDIRWRDDGTNPTSSVGMYLFAANIIELSSPESINNFKAIRVSSDTTLNVSYYVR